MRDSKDHGELFFSLHLKQVAKPSHLEFWPSLGVYEQHVSFRMKNRCTGTKLGFVWRWGVLEERGRSLGLGVFLPGREELAGAMRGRGLCLTCQGDGVWWVVGCCDFEGQCCGFENSHGWECHQVCAGVRNHQKGHFCVFLSSRV